MYPRTVLPVLCTLLVLAACAAAQPNPVTNGGFEQWTPQGAPVDWSVLGKVEPSTDAHSGQRSCLLTREAAQLPQNETGLNRDWVPDSGQQGTMLSQLKGGLRFWYKVLEATDDARPTVFVIPMSGRPMEDTGEPRAAFEVPSGQFGDGQWHQGILAYDFTGNPAVKWVHISPRMMGGASRVLLDDFEYIERVGPRLTPAGVLLKVEGARTIARVKVTNAGDEPIADARFELRPPAGITAECISPTKPEGLSGMTPGDTEYLRFALSAPLSEGARVTAVTSCAGMNEPVEASAVAKADLEVFSLQLDRPIMQVGETATLHLAAYNWGTATAAKVQLFLGIPPEVEVLDSDLGEQDIPPGQWAQHHVRVRPKQETTGAVFGWSVVQGDRSDDHQATFVIAPRERRAPDQPGMWMERDVAGLQGDRMRLIFPPSSFGYGVGFLQVRSDAGWRTVGVLPHAGRVEVKSTAEQPPVYQAYGGARVTRSGLIIRSQFEDADGGTWETTATFRLTRSDDVIEARYTARCNQTRDVLAFEGPVLIAAVGPDSDLSAKDEALFAGLEWLEGPEVSSWDYDIARDAPDRVRFVPHPNKITIPLMSVYGEGTTVGLLWDQHQRWDGANDRPCAEFCSPDYRAGSGGHLMGLFAPSIAGQGWVKENDRIATKPYALPAGQELSLSADLYAATGTRDALTAMDRWFDRYGVIEPAPVPHGSVEGEIAFSMRAYLESLWVPEENTFWTSRGAGPLLSPKGVPPAYEWELRRALPLTGDAALRERWTAMADKIHELTKGATPVAWDHGFDYGGAANWVIGSAAQVQPRTATQRPDGSWRFDADQKHTSGVFRGMDYHELGPNDADEVGTTAFTALQNLQVARVTGNVAAWESGERALRHLERFRIPRAAQVWEVLVHAPDILAAAHAVQACVEAYEYSGDEHWLAEARRWARTGLPFLYCWDDPTQPFLRYGSIPVFGASWNYGSWYGRPVQWNGLDYALAVLRLSRYDDSFPWRRIAEGVTRSAMYMQSDKDEEIALWPDNVGAIKGDRAGWIFEPGMILRNLYPLIGRDCEPQTVILGKLPQRVHVTSDAALSGFTWDGAKLAGTLTYPSGQSGLTIICNVASPEAVLLDGVELPSVNDAEAATEAAWDYRPGYAFLVLRVAADGAHRLEVRGATFEQSSLTPPAKATVNFEFDRDPEGWLPANAVGPLRVREGVLIAPVTANDPYITRANMDVRGEADDVVVIRMRLTGATDPLYGQLYWVTDDSPGYAEDKVAKFDAQGDGQWHDYRIPVGQDRMWAGHHIIGIRLDPFQVPTGEGAQAEVDWLRQE